MDAKAAQATGPSAVERLSAGGRAPSGFEALACRSAPRGCIGYQRAQIPLVQRRELQSALEPQGAPVLQRGAQNDGAHRLFLQMAEEQSPLSPQTWPVLQRGEQAGAAHVPLALQTSEPQSSFEPHGEPRLQLGAHCGGRQRPPWHTKERHWPFWVQGEPFMPDGTEQLCQLASASRIGRRRISAWVLKKVLAVSDSSVPFAMKRPKS